MATGKARQRINKSWRKRHPVKARRISYRSSSYTFIRHYSTPKDIRKMLRLIKQYEPKAEDRAKYHKVYS